MIDTFWWSLLIPRKLINYFLLGLVDSLTKYFTPGAKRTSRTALNSLIKPARELQDSSPQGIWIDWNWLKLIEIDWNWLKLIKTWYKLIQIYWKLTILTFRFEFEPGWGQRGSKKAKKIQRNSKIIFIGIWTGRNWKHQSFSNE